MTSALQIAAMTFYRVAADLLHPDKDRLKALLRED